MCLGCKADLMSSDMTPVVTLWFLATPDQVTRGTTPCEPTQHFASWRKWACQTRSCFLQSRVSQTGPQTSPKGENLHRPNTVWLVAPLISEHRHPALSQSLPHSLASPFSLNCLPELLQLHRNSTSGLSLELWTLWSKYPFLSFLGSPSCPPSCPVP